MRHAIYIASPGGIDIAGPGPCLSLWDGDGGQGLLPGGQVMTYYKAVRPPELPNKRAASAWVVVDMLPATDALGPQGAEVAAIIEKARTLTGDEVRRLDAARAAARAATWAAARDAAWAAARDAARAAARAAARDAARGAARDAARAATWAAARDAARATLVRDLISAEQYATLMGPWLAIMGELS